MLLPLGSGNESAPVAILVAAEVEHREHVSAPVGLSGKAYERIANVTDWFVLGLHTDQVEEPQIAAAICEDQRICMSRRVALECCTHLDERSRRPDITSGAADPCRWLRRER